MIDYGALLITLINNNRRNFNFLKFLYEQAVEFLRN